MKKEQKFLICRHCGNIVGMVFNAGISMECCGDKMEVLTPNTVEASVEKHLPVIATDGNRVTVTVGSVSHPMAFEHYIEWIYIETKRGGQRKDLNPGEEPMATFVLEDDELISAYAFCNLHGLWKTEADK